VSDDEQAAAQLNRLTAEFPAFSIALESMADNAIRFVARNRHPDVHPRTVVTSDVTELRAALSADQSPA
jgi:hypothetical protein